MQNINKFYVGAKHIGSAILNGRNAGCTKATIEEAIEDAKRMIRNNEVECVVVVEIKLVVHRETPIVIEEV